MALIEAEHLSKEFTLVKKQGGFVGSLKSLLRVEKKQVLAVDDISFHILAGEIVGYIGPNGAGKSTTIKMLTGILHPSSGEVRIAGISPQRDRKAVVKRLGVVFGQRTQLYWDLRLGESFELMKRIYRIDDRIFRENLQLMDRVLGTNELSDIPVRQLSLGQRMRGDLAAAMLHSPSILFLDEPTIGLDVEAKHAIRDFIREINRQRGVTVILTTHDLDDVEQLCQRLIVVSHGKLVQDGPLDELVARMAPHRLLVLDLEELGGDLSHPEAALVKIEGLRVWYRFNKHDISARRLISELSARLPVADLSVKEPDIEEAIRELYRMKN